MRSLLLSIFLACAFLLLSDHKPAQAYAIHLCNGEPAVWDIGPEPTLDELPQFRTNGLSAPFFTLDSFYWGAQAWNRNPSAMLFHPILPMGTPEDPFGFSYTVGWGNFHSEVWTMLDDDFFDGAAARASFWLTGCEIDEADIVFNSAIDWISSFDLDAPKEEVAAYGLSGNKLDVQSILVHELGHAAGFSHICDYYNTMGLTHRHHITNGGRALQYVGQDLVRGLVDNYESGGGIFREDVAVTHWKFKDCFVSQSGEFYSRHQLTELYDQNGLPLDVVDPNEFERRYIAAAGETIQAEFTFENLGATEQFGVQVGYYYSEDDLITTLDQKIAQTTVNLVGEIPLTIAVTMTLPDDLPQGDGYLGVIIDDDDVTIEINETNNATYLPIRIAGFAEEKLEELRTAYRYAAKIVCGIQDDPEDLRLISGSYGTTVNILNPGGETVRFRKDLALAYPPAEQIQGDVTQMGIDSLDPLHALKTDCNEIRDRVFAGSYPAPYIEGFVVLTSPEELDVTAVYTSGAVQFDFDEVGKRDNGKYRYYPCDPSPCKGSPDMGRRGDGAIGLDVERIPGRKVMARIPPEEAGFPDLVPFPTGEPVTPALPQTAWCVIEDGMLHVTVRNQGVAGAGASTTSVSFEGTGVTSHRPTSALGPDQNVVVLFPYPSACIGCRFQITVDSAEDVAESNEANNEAAGFCHVPPG